MVVLVRPRPSTDYAGIALGLTAAVCWACYILLNRTVGRRLPGLEGSAAAAAVSGALYLPVGVVVLWRSEPSAVAVLCALGAGVLSSAVPLLADLLALRRVPAHFFGIFMSVNPVFAALIGLVVLGQHLDPWSWAAIAVIVGANAVAAGRVRAAGRRSGRQPTGLDGPQQARQRGGPGGEHPVGFGRLAQPEPVGAGRDLQALVVVGSVSREARLLPDSSVGFHGVPRRPRPVWAVAYRPDLLSLAAARP